MVVILEKLRCNEYECLGTIHILRNHIFRNFGPPSPLSNHVFSTENNRKLTFSDPPPPLQVITEYMNGP